MRDPDIPAEAAERQALVLELAMPFFAFGPRPLKLVCFAALSVFHPAREVAASTVR